MPRSNLAEVALMVARAVGGSRPAAVISNATLANQQSVSGPLEQIARLADQAAIGTPATLVVGDVVAAAPALSVLPNSFVDVAGSPDRSTGGTRGSEVGVLRCKASSLPIGFASPATMSSSCRS